MFCKTVWNGLHILPDGYIRLCSIGANTKAELDMQRCRDKNGQVMHILTHDIKEIMNSDKHREVRLANMKDPNAWSPHCSCCENREIVTNFNRNHKNKSRRIYLMSIDNDDIVTEHNFKDKADDNGYVDWMPNSLDIRFGNLCNQKCVMCSPIYSNLWYQEHFDFFKTNSFGQGNKIKVYKDKNNKWVEPKELTWFEDPRWWEKFEQMMPYLKHIYITGGEPMVTPAHDTMLDKLIESGYSKNIWLEYDSNCSALNNKIVDRWSNFKKVEIRGSMDAIDDQYELIRFGGNWKKFVKNILKLNEFKKTTNNKIELTTVTACFQISTMFSIIESEKWCKENGLNYHIRFLEGPSRHSVASLSTDAKLKLIEYYQQYESSSEKAVLILKYLKNHLSDKLHKINSIKEYITFMNYLDSTRNTDWKSTLPEVYNLVKYAEQ